MNGNCKDGVCVTQTEPQETETLSTVCEQGMFGDLGVADATVTEVDK